MVRDTKPNSRELKRGFTFDRASVDVENRRVALAFSSELPYERYFGMEVLGHEPGEVDLSRLADGTHPLLLNHNRDQQIGVVEEARVDKDKIGRATVRFSKSTLGQEIFQDVLDGIRSQVSVAYEVRDWKITKEKEGKPETWRATKWQPFEVSIVSIAADSEGAGIGKDKSNVPKIEKVKAMDETEKLALERQRAEDKQTLEKQLADERKKMQEDAANERKRVTELRAIGRKFKMEDEADKAIEDGTSISDFRGQALEALNKPAKAVAVTDTRVATRKTIGQMFVEHPTFQARKFKPGDRINCSVQIDGADQFSRATLSISGESLTSIVDLPGIVVPDRRVLRVADLFPSGSISSGSLRYVREASYTNAATRVAEGSEKPAATIDLEQVTDTVEKTAVVVKVTDEMLADFPATASYIDNYLAYSVQQLEDTQLISGTGSSQIRGILNVANINSQSVTGLVTPADGFHKAITKVRLNGNVEPNYFIVNPLDYENLRLTKDGNNQYYGGGPFSGPYGNGQYSNVMNLWGLPAVVTAAMAQGTALVGNFSIGAMIFRRTGLTVESTNSNENDFLLNLVALRAEQRMLLATWKPLAFAKITDIPAS